MDSKLSFSLIQEYRSLTYQPTFRSPLCVIKKITLFKSFRDRFYLVCDRVFRKKNRNYLVILNPVQIHYLQVVMRQESAGSSRARQCPPYYYDSFVTFFILIDIRGSSVVLRQSLSNLSYRKSIEID